jgi:hypothetical protein
MTPEILPVADSFTYGTIAYTLPSAAWTRREKTTMAVMNLPND